jgi:hypothetical protein
LDLDEVTQDGGATIDYLSVEMDSGYGFFEVATPFTSPVVITHADIVSGKSLEFKYRAHNVHGWSDYSPSSTIVAATVPEVPTGVSTVTVQFDPKVHIEWQAPINTGGNSVAILEYRVIVLIHDGVTY